MLRVFIRGLIPLSIRPFSVSGSVPQCFFGDVPRDAERGVEELGSISFLPFTVRFSYNIVCDGGDELQQIRFEIASAVPSL